MGHLLFWGTGGTLTAKIKDVRRPRDAIQRRNRENCRLRRCYDWHIRSSCPLVLNLKLSRTTMTDFLKSKSILPVAAMSDTNPLNPNFVAAKLRRLT